MTNSVTFPIELGGSGAEYSDGNDPTTGLGNDGHRTLLIPMLADSVAIAAQGKLNMQSAQAAAEAAVNAPGTLATSTSVLAIGLGSKTLDIQTGKSLAQGCYVTIASVANETDAMFGPVADYNPATGDLEVTVQYKTGAGTFANWTVSICGPALELSDETPQPLGVASPGNGGRPAREGHVHAHGDQAGGSLHANASAGGAGFMSVASFNKAEAAIPNTYLDTDTALSANSDTKIATQKATKAYVDALLAAQDAMVFKGVINCAANPNYPAADRGHTYRVSVAGKIGGASGPNVEVGDLLLCITDSTAGGTHAGVGANWSIIQMNLDGAVIGPVSATDGHAVLFDGASGKLIKTAGFAPQPVDSDLTAIAALAPANDDFMQRKAGAWTNRTAAQVTVDLQGTGLDVDAAGFRGIPQNIQAANYTCVAADSGKEIFHASGAGAGDTYTIPSNASVAYEIGTCLTFTNLDTNPVSIAITTDTLRLAGTALTGTRTLAPGGTAVASKKTSTLWLISGPGLT